MLKIPVEPSCVRIERHCRAREQTLISRLRTATDPQPGFCLCDTPVGLVQLRIVGARDPGIAACAQMIGESSPGIAAELSFTRDRLKFPYRLTGIRIPRADVAALF